MTRLLPPVLTPLDLPAPELAAARLDGELYPVGAGYAPVDEDEQPEHRARSLSSGAHARLIAEQATAAWVWGARPTMPSQRQFCVAIGARINRATTAWHAVREVVIEPSEVVTLGGAQVTTPLRTCVDLARFSVRFDAHEVGMLRGLLQRGNLTIADCVDDINRRRNLPNKHLALQRLLRADRPTAAQ